MRKFTKLLLAAVLVIGMVSCSPKTWKKINYLQDVHENTKMEMPLNEGIIIQPQDQLSIIVSSQDPSLAATFNLAVSSYFAGSEIGAGAGSQRITGYTVNNDGNIMFPTLGSLHVAGLTRWELQQLVAGKLAETGLLRDAIVTVEFMNFKISILGDVSSPGTYAISGDKITIFQALSLARDLTIYGKRDDVMVIREQNGNRQIFMLDLRDSKVFDSPAYYLQQNDIVYVTPNTVRAGQSTINENYFKSASFWISLASTAMTIANLTITILRFQNNQ